MAQMEEFLPPLPKHWNAELEAIVDRHDGLFWLEAEDRQGDYGKMMEVVVSRINNHANFSQSQLYSEKPRVLEWGFTNNSSFNAFAYSSKSSEIPEFDFIGINIGSFYTFLTIFLRILSHPGTFLDVGNPEKELKERSYIPYLTQDAIKSDFSMIFPICPIRGNFAVELSKIAMDFLFFHEVTHLRNGHIEFFREKLSIIGYLEASSDYTQSSNFIRQILEIDADCGSILHTLNYLYSLKDIYIDMKNNKKGNLSVIDDITYGSAYSIVRMLTFTLHVIFRLSNLDEWYSDHQINSKHPFDPLRLTYFGPTILEIFRTRAGYDYDPDEFLKDDLKFVEEAELACGLIQNDEGPNVRGLLSVFENPLTYKYFDDFKSTWKEIRPSLEKYKRGGILPE